MRIFRDLVCCGPSRDTWNGVSDRCFHFFPCLSDPVRRSTLYLKVAVVMLHLIFVGVLFLFDRDFREKTRLEPWYMTMYLLLFVATLAQYFFISGSSPGYVLDAMRTVSETDTLLTRPTVTSKQPASSKNGTVVITVDRNELGRNLLGNNAMYWTKLVMDMYPPGTSARTYTCSYCDVLQHENPPENEAPTLFGNRTSLGARRPWWNQLQLRAASRIQKLCSTTYPARSETEKFSSCLELQDWENQYYGESDRESCLELPPPRVKHCHDCDKCVLQFDHHCVWLGTCIGQGNHCRFWWYICEETALCLWTVILYITFLKANIAKAWWVDVIMIMLLATLSISLIFLLLLLLFHSYLVMTNQTTFELVRRRRIPYLRGIPERVYPFSKGVCRNLYIFCCGRSSIQRMEPLPTAQELEEKSKPYTCLNVLSCRCCC